MINTVPLPKQPKRGRSQSRSNTPVRSKHAFRAPSVKPRKASGSLLAVGVIASVAVVGLVVLRVSRAGTVPGTYTNQQLEIARSQVSAISTNLQTLAVSGTTPLQFTPTSSNQAFVGYTIDGNLVGVSNQAPFVINYDTTNLSNGDHQLEVVVYDSAGNVVETKGYTLTVQNSANIVHDLQKAVLGR